MALAINNIKNSYKEKFYIGEAVYLTDIYNILSKTKGVIDVKKVNIYNKFGGSYATTSFDFDKIKSRDGTYYRTPKNVVLELRYPDLDIKGIAK